MFHRHHTESFSQQRMHKPHTPIAMLTIVLLTTALAWYAGALLQHDRANRALIAAVKSSSTSAAVAALEVGADPNARDDGGFLPTTRRRLRQRFCRLRGQNAQPDDDPKPTALLVAFEGQSAPNTSLVVVSPENVALVEVLLDRGAAIDARDVNGETALLLAILEGYTDTVKLLLDKGANVNVVAQGASPGTALTEAAEFGHTRIVEMLLARGAGANVRDTSSSTPLIFAAVFGHTAIVQTLLRNGADVNARDVDGWTALMFAAENGRTETVKALLDAGADPIVRDERRYSALKSATQHGYPEIVRLLKKAGAK